MSVAQQLIDFLREIPPEIATVIIAMMPFAELRGALPVALLVYELPVPVAVILSIIGNMLPVYFLLVFFEAGSNYLSQRSPWWDRFFERRYARTRGKLESQVEKYGPWALATFVAIPFPATGAWTGALAAFVFGLDRMKAFLAILLGVTIAAFIMVLLTLSTSFTVRALLI